MNSELPVTQYKEAILASIKENPLTIIVAETGAGKSTQVPQYLIEAGYNIVVTQPRRLAARTVAERVAEEVDCRIGDQVGYRISRDGEYTSDTQCLFVTDGLALVRELMGQGNHNILVIDEVHEWNLNIEVLVAWVKLRLADDINFKVVLMSATLEADKLSAFFDGAPIINVPGRLFPVTVQESVSATNAEEARRLLDEGHNVLVFEPGKAEIEQTIAALKKSGVDAVILPLYGELDSSEQRRCFAQYSKPKCVVSTNVAETSITIPDITAVVDGGMERRVEVVDGVQGLYLRPISKANAKQRQGRAGRCAPGVYVDRCVSRDTRPEYPVAEIMRLRLDQTVLRLAQAGFDMETLHFFHQPKIEEIRRAKKSLKALGCMTQDGQVTKIGNKVAQLPISVQFARMVVEAERLGVVDDVVTIAAILEGGEITARPDELGCEPWRQYIRNEEKSDVMAQLLVYRAATELDRRDLMKNGIFPKAFFRAREIRTHIRQGLEGYVEFRSNNNRENILKAVCAGMVDHLYQVRYGQLINGDGTYREINRWSVTKYGRGDGWVVGIPFDLPIKSRFGEKILRLVRMVSVIDPMWLVEIAPQMVTREEGVNPIYDCDQDCVVGTTRVMFNGQVIQEYLEANPEHPDRVRIKGAYLNRKAWEEFISPNNISRPTVSLTSPTVVRHVYGVCALTGAELVAFGTAAIYGMFPRTLQVKWFHDVCDAVTYCEEVVGYLEQQRMSSLEARPFTPAPTRTPSVSGGGFGSLADIFEKIGR